MNLLCQFIALPQTCTLHHISIDQYTSKNRQAKKNPKCQFLLSDKRCQRPHPQFQSGITCAGKEYCKYFIVCYTANEIGISPFGLQIQAQLISDDPQHISWQLSSFNFRQPLGNCGVILAALASSPFPLQGFLQPSLTPSSSFSVWLMFVWCNFCYHWWMFLFFGVLLLLLPVYLRIAKQKPFSRSLENCLTSYYCTVFMGV